MRQRFLLKKKTSETDIKALRGYVREVLHKSKALASHPTAEITLGSSGTIKAIKRMLEKSGRGSKIRRKHLSNLNESICLMSDEELLEVPGMNPKRTEIIVPGSLLLEELMLFLEIPSVHFTPFALRDGLLNREIEAFVEA